MSISLVSFDKAFSLLDSLDKFSTNSFKEVLMVLRVSKNGIKKLYLTKRSNILVSMCILATRAELASSLKVVLTKRDFLGRVTRGHLSKKECILRDVGRTRLTNLNLGRRKSGSLASKLSPCLSLDRIRFIFRRNRILLLRKLREMFDRRSLRSMLSNRGCPQLQVGILAVGTFALTIEMCGTQGRMRVWATFATTLASDTLTMSVFDVHISSECMCTDPCGIAIRGKHGSTKFTKIALCLP
jgi:hypothetical protein